MNPPVLRPAAAADVEDAWRWYEARREGLGDEFLDVVQASLESTCAHPESAPLVHRELSRQAQPSSLALSVVTEGHPGAPSRFGGAEVSVILMEGR